MTDIDRRELLRQMAAAAAVTSLGRVGRLDAQEGSNGASRFFPGFAVSKVRTSGATIHVVKGGDGPPPLLLHGAPQSHVSWRLVAPDLTVAELTAFLST
jgi:haloacetate dehalogenase